LIAEFQTIHDRAQTVSNVSAWATTGMRLNGDTHTNLVQFVSCGFFNLYGLERAEHGRLLQKTDCNRGAAVVVLSDEIWRARFHSDAGVISSAVWLAGRPFTVVGIVPPGFSGRLRGSGIWLPYTATGEIARPWLTIEGRVRPGYSREAAAAELTALAGHTMTLTNGSLIEMPAASQAALWATPLVMGALTLLLLLACMNVTVLLLSRAAARRYDMGVRLALGARPRRLFRMAATEGVLLATIAGVASAFVARLVPAGMRAIVPQMPYYPMTVDWIVFAYLAGITLAAGCLACRTPAAESLRTALTGSLKGQTGKWKLRDILIAAQVAVSLFLLVGAALFARTQLHILAGGQTDAARHTMTISISRSDWDRVSAQVRALPGVRSVEPGTHGELLAHFDGDAAVLAREIREALQKLNVEPRDLPETLADLTAEMSGRFRSVTAVTFFLGIAALVLAVIGIYGVIEYAADLRMKEFGIRLAMGGAKVLGQALRKAPASFVAMDPTAFVAAGVLVIAASAAAMLRPALRAAKWDPMVSLRRD
jgi:hypothetical protein